MIEETNTSVTMQRNYFFGVYPEQGRRAGHRIAWRDSSGNVYYYFADAIGSAVRTNMECQQEVNYHPSW